MDPLMALLTELITIAEQPAGWDGHDAKALSKPALLGAHRALLEVSRHGPLPERLVPDVTGGVAFYWFGAERTAGGGHRLSASLKVDDEGDLFVSLVDRATQRVEVSEASTATLGAAIDRMAAFVGLAEARAAS